MTADRGKDASTFMSENGAITLPTILLFLAVPLFLSGRYWHGGAMIVFCLSLAARNATNTISEYDKQKIRCGVMEPEEIVKDLTESLARKEPPMSSEDIYLKIQATLSALAMRHAKDGPEDPIFPLLCQQVAYLALKMYPSDLKMASEAISMLALVAKNDRVRLRHKNQADKYGLDVPIKVMRDALQKAKNEEDQDREREVAEFQRRCCLFLGAVADEDKEYDLGLSVVEEGGLEAVLDAASWFRCHSEVSNWALWAIFVLCYQNSRNKLQFIRLDGINIVCQSLENNSDSLDVCRHGIALLFDLLRSGQEDKTLALDPWKIRKLALAAGMHGVTKKAMENFPSTMDIMMMGQEMLIGTGYDGVIPQYEMPKQ